jgi:hypothetical protein
MIVFLVWVGYMLEFKLFFCCHVIAVEENCELSGIFYGIFGFLSREGVQSQIQVFVCCYVSAGET